MTEPRSSEPRWSVDVETRLKMADVLTAYTREQPGPLFNDESYDLTGPLIDVLFDAGLLVAPGGEVREEWSTTLTIEDGGGSTNQVELVHRTVHTGPWLPAARLAEEENRA